MMSIKSNTSNGLSSIRCLSILVSLLVAAFGGASLAGENWPPAPPLEAKVSVEAAIVPPSITAETIGPGRWRCTFRFRPPAPAKSVALAGTFNGWNRNAMLLSGPDGEGFWSGTLKLGAGKHLYKFVVDGEHWRHDPENPDREHDGHSGNNSILRLGRLAGLKSSSAKRGDGNIDAIGLKHQPYSPMYFQALSMDRALVRVRMLAHDVEHVWLAQRDGGLTEMRLVQEDERFALYEARATLSARATRRPGIVTTEYTFVFTDDGQRASSPETYVRSFTEIDIFETPDWAKHAIWYQIMVDRFRNSSAENDPENVRPWTSDWFSSSPWETRNGWTFYKFFVFHRLYGGDIAGLEEALPYLRDLGVNALYFNPIFKAPTHHKYDTLSYVHIDDHFGTKGDYEAVAATEDLLDPSTWKWTESDKRFLRFLRKAHTMGFRVIVDGVFNHVGRRHPAFQDVMKNGKQSRYADWFTVTSWEPFEYTGWAGVRDLPEFRKDANGLASAAAKAHIFAITRRWMDPNGDGDPSDGIDGWRLDVPNEIPEPFWVEWRKVVKSVNPDAYITGEIWDQANMWLDGKHFDAVMNYPFSRAVVAWIMDREWKIKVSEFDRRLRELRLAYPLPATLVLQNLMNSHDTDRLVSMAINPDRAYDHANRVQDNGPDYDNSKPDAEAYRKARLVVLLQMTYLGAPMVYYGDEVGMWGADDPTCRKPMFWEDRQPYEKPEENFVMADHREFYRKAIRLRRSHPALRTGAFQTLLTDDANDVWAFLRWDDDEQLIVALNASNQPRVVSVPLPTHSPNPWKGVFGVEGHFRAADRTIELHVPALGGVVLHSPTPK